MSIHSDYFVFIGEHATTGEPHRLTGFRSTFGQTFRFRTKKAAQAYLEDASYHPIMAIGKIKQIRRFHWGLSVDQMNEHFNCLDYEVSENG